MLAEIVLFLSFVMPLPSLFLVERVVPLPMTCAVSKLRVISGTLSMPPVLDNLHIPVIGMT